MDDFKRSLWCDLQPLVREPIGWPDHNNHDFCPSQRLYEREFLLYGYRWQYCYDSVDLQRELTVHQHLCEE